MPFATPATGFRQQAPTPSGGSPRRGRQSPNHFVPGIASARNWKENDHRRMSGYPYFWRPMLIPAGSSPFMARRSVSRAGYVPTIPKSGGRLSTTENHRPSRKTVRPKGDPDGLKLDPGIRLSLQIPVQQSNDFLGLTHSFIVQCKCNLQNSRTTIALILQNRFLQCLST